MNRTAKNLVWGLLGAGLFGGAAVTLSTIVEYKPYGVPDHRRGEYEAKLAEISLKNELLRSTDATARPQAVVENPTFDFGMLDPHTSASHAFVITNGGGSPLALEVTQTSCKCTTGRLDQSVLEPGESTEVVLTWNTGLESDDYSQTASVKTNDPFAPELTLTVRGTIRTDLGMPESIAFEASDPASQTRAAFTIYSQLWNDFTVTNIHSDLGSFDWYAEPLDAGDATLIDKNARSAWKVTVMTAAMDYGKFVGQLTVEIEPADGSETRTRMVNATGRVRSPIAFYSPMLHRETGLDLGTVTAGKPYQWSLVVRVRGDQERSIDVLKVEPKELQASIEPMSQPGNFRLTLSIAADCPMVMFNADTKHGYVQVGDPDDPKFMNWFPVHGAVVELDQ